MFKTFGMDSSSAEPTDLMGTGFKWTGDAYKEYPNNISDCATSLAHQEESIVMQLILTSTWGSGSNK